MSVIYRLIVIFSFFFFFFNDTATTEIYTLSLHDALPTSPAVTPPLASPPVVEDKEVVEPAARELITRAWASYHLPYAPARWQEARRDFERALELDSRSSEARIGLASILSTK